MAEIHKLSSNYATLQAGVIRNRESTSDEIRVALTRLGEEIGRSIVSVCHVKAASITTRLNDALETIVLDKALSVVITTKTDMPTFGRAIASVMNPCVQGSMNFEGRRGLAALNAPIRGMDLPELGSRQVESVVIGKSILATGCTAISLTKSAMQEYSPMKVIIAAVFYSLSGLSEVQHVFPNSVIFVVGEPIPLNDDGTLAIGLIEELI